MNKQDDAKIGWFFGGVVVGGFVMAVLLVSGLHSAAAQPSYNKSELGHLFMDKRINVSGAFNTSRVYSNLTPVLRIAPTFAYLEIFYDGKSHRQIDAGLVYGSVPDSFANSSGIFVSWEAVKWAANKTSGDYKAKYPVALSYWNGLEVERNGTAQLGNCVGIIYSRGLEKSFNDSTGGYFAPSMVVSNASGVFVPWETVRKAMPENWLNASCEHSYGVVLNWVEGAE